MIKPTITSRFFTPGLFGTHVKMLEPSASGPPSLLPLAQTALSILDLQPLPTPLSSAELRSRQRDSLFTVTEQMLSSHLTWILLCDYDGWVHRFLC